MEATETTNTAMIFEGRRQASKIKRLNNMIDENEALMKMLLHGTSDQIRSISRETIIKSLWAIQRIDLPLPKKLVIWDVLKDEKPVGSLKRSLFEASGSLLLTIPENDLFNVNVSDWKIAEFFGTLRGLSRRQAGVLGYALKKAHGNDMLHGAGVINRIKGLICGFSLHDLGTISESEFTAISNDVFDNIGACTPAQKKVLLKIATRLTVFGPPMVWDASLIGKLGLLVTAMDKETLTKVKPEAISGVNSATLKLMSSSQIRCFSSEQLEYMNDLTLAEYRKMMGVPSNGLVDVASNKFMIFVIASFMV